MNLNEGSLDLRNLVKTKCYIYGCIYVGTDFKKCSAMYINGESIYKKTYLFYLIGVYLYLYVAAVFYMLLLLSVLFVKKSKKSYIITVLCFYTALTLISIKSAIDLNKVK